MECFPQDGVAAANAPPPRLEPCGKERHHHPVCDTSADRRSGFLYRREKHELTLAAVAYCTLRNLTLYLCDDGLRLRKPVQFNVHLE